MYLDIFGLRQLPFRLRPEPAFWYADSRTARARDQLVAALRRHDALTIVSGDAGIGKSLLVEAALAATVADRPVLRVNHPRMSWSELTQAIALQLPAGARDAGENISLPALLAEAASAAPPVLLVDQGQLIAPTTLEALLALTVGGTRLGIVLQACGGACPWAAIDWTAAQVAPITLEPLAPDEIAPYIEHRLRIAGAARPKLFTREACDQIFTHAHGVPRAINALCDRALTLAAARHMERITDAEIREAAQDPGWREPRVSDLEPSTAAPETAQAPVAPRVPPAGRRIVVLKDARPVAELPLIPGRLQIGRAPDNDVALASRYVSRRHCELITVGDGADAHTVLVDLGSHNGTLVNGRRIKRHQLARGDVVRLGDHELRCVSVFDSGVADAG